MFIFLFILHLNVRIFSAYLSLEPLRCETEPNPSGPLGGLKDVDQRIAPEVLRLGVL